MAEQEELRHVVQPILRWGMVLSLVFMLIGLLLGAVVGTASSDAVPLEGIPSGLLEMDPVAYLTTGILLLIATPIARILGALFVFLKERDVQLILVSIAVLLSVAMAVFFGTI